PEVSSGAAGVVSSDRRGLCGRGRCVYESLCVFSSARVSDTGSVLAGACKNCLTLLGLAFFVPVHTNSPGSKSEPEYFPREPDNIFAAVTNPREYLSSICMRAPLRSTATAASKAW
ncbi:unnamed protein product, partial [Pylaiella littoralis]